MKAFSIVKTKSNGRNDPISRFRPEFLSNLNSFYQQKELFLNFFLLRSMTKNRNRTTYPYFSFEIIIFVKDMNKGKGIGKEKRTKYHDIALEDKV